VPALAVVVETLGIEAVAKRIQRIDANLLNTASQVAVNAVAQRTFDESRRRMTARVNLTDDYVRSRMDLEAANDPNKPTAVIVAFRKGGRRPATRPVNLRQYAPIVQAVPNRQQNASKGKTFAIKPAREGEKARQGAFPWGPNPRAPGKKLPFILRTGNPMLNIPVGQKQGQLTVEVLKGSRKAVTSKKGYPAFMQRMRNGEILVMARTDKNGGKKGKGNIEALYSLSVWQLFRKTSAEVIPLVREDLEKSVGEAVSRAVDEVFA
jgi:hypothetical protein